MREEKEQKCKHEFTHIVADEEMINQYKRQWKATRIVIYCKNCGMITKDRIENNSGT